MSEEVAVGLPAGEGCTGREGHLSQCCPVGREQGGGPLQTSLPRAWSLAISPPEPECHAFCLRSRS